MRGFPRVEFRPGHSPRDIRAVDIIAADRRARLDRAALELVLVRYLGEHGYAVARHGRQKLPHVLLVEQPGPSQAERCRAQD